MQPLIDSLLTIPLPICCLPFLTSFTNLLKVFYFGLTFAVVAPVSFWRFFATHQFLGDLLLLQVMMMRTPLYPSLPYISLTYNCTFFIYLPPDCLGLFVPLPFSYTWLAFSALFFWRNLHHVLVPPQRFVLYSFVPGQVCHDLVKKASKIGKLFRIFFWQRKIIRDV